MIFKQKDIKRIWKLLVILALALMVAAVFYYWGIRESQPNSVLKEGNLYLPSNQPMPNGSSSFKTIQPEIPTVSLIAVGDIMLSRVVAQKMKKYKNNDYPFLKIAELLKSADITFGNLETAITPGRPIQTGEMIFRADPESAVALKKAGFDILSLANNHTPNFGQEGLLDTFRYLRQADIHYIGAGVNKLAARRPLIQEIKGLKFAFLAYNDTDVVPAGYQAGAEHAGTVFMDVLEMQSDIRQVRGEVDFVIVSMHSGIEYQTQPNARQISFAHQAIEAGAKLIIGHHPHVVQSLEAYQDGWIIYSLGNFIFDQMWSSETREGLIAEIIFNPNNIQTIEFYPVIIEDYSQPRLANQEEAGKILERIKL